MVSGNNIYQMAQSKHNKMTEEQSELNRKLLDAIKDVTADTGNWGDYGGQNKQSQIDAANECERICLQEQIDLLQKIEDDLMNVKDIYYMKILLKEQLNQLK